MGCCGSFPDPTYTVNATTKAPTNGWSAGLDSPQPSPPPEARRVVFMEGGAPRLQTKGDTRTPSLIQTLPATGNSDKRRDSDGGSSGATPDLLSTNMAQISAMRGPSPGTAPAAGAATTTTVHTYGQSFGGSYPTTYHLGSMANFNFAETKRGTGGFGTNRVMLSTTLVATGVSDGKSPKRSTRAADRAADPGINHNRARTPQQRRDETRLGKHQSNASEPPPRAPTIFSRQGSRSSMLTPAHQLIVEHARRRSPDVRPNRLQAHQPLVAARLVVEEMEAMPVPWAMLTYHGARGEYVIVDANSEMYEALGYGPTSASCQALHGLPADVLVKELSVQLIRCAADGSPQTGGECNRLPVYDDDPTKTARGGGGPADLVRRMRFYEWRARAVHPPSFTQDLSTPEAAQTHHAKENGDGGVTTADEAAAAASFGRWIFVLWEVTEWQLGEHRLNAQLQRQQVLIHRQLPADQAAILLNGGKPEEQDHRCAVVGFLDLKNSTAMTRNLSSDDRRALMRKNFAWIAALDKLAVEVGVRKIETAGDSYLVVAFVQPSQSAVPCKNQNQTQTHTQNPDHNPADIKDAKLDLGKELVVPEDNSVEVGVLCERSKQVALFLHYALLLSDKDYEFKMRAGMHAGPLSSGLCGELCPKFTIFGDTVILCARLQASADVGSILVTAAYAERIQALAKSPPPPPNAAVGSSVSRQAMPFLALGEVRNDYDFKGFEDVRSARTLSVL